MNEKAKELGLNNSHFDSPHGLDSDEHYTTAYELALLSDYALKSKIFLDIVGTKNHTISINGSPKNLSNTNELLGNLLGIYGIKTGFTNGANRCLVTACKRDDMDIICVVLGCDTKKFRTQDSIKLIEYAFKNFEYVNIKEKIDTEFEKWKQENRSNFYIYKGINSNLSLKYDSLENSIIPIRKENISSLKIYINVNRYLSAPIAENTVIGKIEVVTNNSSESIAINVLSSNSISKKSFSNYLLEFLKSYSSRLSSTVTTFSASLSGISISNSSSKAITNSTISSESAPKSSINDASIVTAFSDTPNCSIMIPFTFSNTSSELIA